MNRSCEDSICAVYQGYWSIRFIQSDSEKMIVLHGGDKSEHTILIGSRARTIVMVTCVWVWIVIFTSDCGARAYFPLRHTVKTWCFLCLTSLERNFSIFCGIISPFRVKFVWRSTQAQKKSRRTVLEMFGCTVLTHKYLHGSRGEWSAIFSADDGSKFGAHIRNDSHRMLIENQDFSHSVLHFFCD